MLLETLDRWLGPTGTLEVDLFKLPHHGSKANVTDALTKRVRAKCYVFSSSGQGRSQHPNDPAVARVIINSAGTGLLAFNYRNKRTEMWEDAALQTQWGYRTRLPGGGRRGNHDRSSRLVSRLPIREKKPFPSKLTRISAAH